MILVWFYKIKNIYFSNVEFFDIVRLFLLYHASLSIKMKKHLLKIKQIEKMIYQGFDKKVLQRYRSKKMCNYNKLLIKMHQRDKNEELPLT